MPIRHFRDAARVADCRIARRLCLRHAFAVLSSTRQVPQRYAAMHADALEVRALPPLMRPPRVFDDVIRRAFAAVFMRASAMMPRVPDILRDDADCL